MSDLDKLNETLGALEKSVVDSRKVNDERLEALEKNKGVAELEEKAAKYDEEINALLESKETLTKSVDEVKAAVARMNGSADLDANGEPKVDMKSYSSALKKMAAKNFEKSEVRLTEAEEKAMQSNIDPDGGYTVMPFMSNVRETIDFDTSPVRALASVQTIGTNEYCFFYDDNDATGSWVGEVASRATTATPEIGKGRIPVHTMYARPKISEELLEDSSWNLEAWIQEKHNDKFSRVESTAFVTGDGVAKPQGFMTGTNKTSNPDVYARDQIGTLTAAGAAAITTDELVTLRGYLKKSYRGNAYWCFNRATEAYIRKLKDGQGNYIWQPSYQAGEADMLLGQRIAIMEDMADLATGALTVALADLRSSYQIVDRLGMAVLKDPYTLIPYVSFYMRKRVGGGIKNWDAMKYLVQA
jgi:HK97 family phage major capsid protein